MTNIRALSCPPKSFRQFCSIFDLIERRERPSRQYLPHEILPPVPIAPAAVHWREGNDTAEIAALLRVPEAAVWNAMPLILAVARARRQSA